MSWICPKCRKRFKHTNQAHSCARVGVKDHFRNKPPQRWATFEKLIKKAREFGAIKLNPVKTSIQVKAAATFLSIRVKSDRLEIEFQLSDEHDRLPIYKTFRISKNRVLHFAVLERPEDVTLALSTLLRKSYTLMKN